jgi:hypothetical protein
MQRSRVRSPSAPPTQDPAGHRKPRHDAVFCCFASRSCPVVPAPDAAILAVASATILFLLNEATAKVEPVALRPAPDRKAVAYKLADERGGSIEGSQRSISPRRSTRKTAHSAASIRCPQNPGAPPLGFMVGSRNRRRNRAGPATRFLQVSPCLLELHGHAGAVEPADRIVRVDVRIGIGNVGLVQERRQLVENVVDADLHERVDRLDMVAE